MTLVALTLLAILFPGCSTRRAPTLEPLRVLEPKTPVILIPGLGGTRLRDKETGRLLWGKARNAMLPRDGGYRMARAIDPDPGWSEQVEAYEAMTKLRVAGVWPVDIYASLIRTMEDNGYRVGDLFDPRPGDTFFVFPYDFRYANVDTTRRLAERLEHLRQVRGDTVLRVNFICHSYAALIARYFVKYGGESLDLAEQGGATRPANIRVDKLILVGPTNGGTLSTFEELNRGRKYIPVVGRRFTPEVLFTFRALYDTLPAYRADLFFDGEGQELEIDLFDPESWKRYGWSIFGDKVQRKLRKRGRTDLFGDPERQFAFLTEMLDRSRRLHALLMRDVEGFGETRYYMLTNVGHPTADRAVLVESRGEWKILFSDDRKIKRNKALSAQLSSPGDGKTTVASQQWLSPQEVAAISGRPDSIPTRHRYLISHPMTRQRILEHLLERPALAQAGAR